MDVRVAVDGGQVRGRDVGGVLEFLGIPYARAPVGPLRWRPPLRPEPWRGVREATEAGPLAPQGAGRPQLPGEPVHQSEDCLHVSVWTPALDGGGRPVMVWVHGGSFMSGTAGSVLYRGAELARRGDVVVVTVNYRLGALGFLAHPELATEGGAFGNWALMDHVAALRWVRSHAGAFGGDPANVTVFGESAGAMCAATLLAMPEAAGLFRRVILQSGPPYTQTAARAATRAEALTRELGLGGVSRTALERVPADELVAALGTLARRGPDAGELPQPLLPVVDGRSLPEAPLEALARGRGAAVPAIVGTNRDEVTFFDLALRRDGPMDDEALTLALARSAPSVDTGEILAAYRAALARRGEPSGARDVWIAAASDLVFRWPSLRLAATLGRREPRTFVYLFTWECPAFAGTLGACHGLELPFVFGTLRNPAVAAFTGGGATAEGLSDRMQAAWVAFARGDDPSGPDAWPAWDPVRRATMVLGAESGVAEAPRDEELAVWAGAFPLPSGAADGVAAR